MHVMVHLVNKLAVKTLRIFKLKHNAAGEMPALGHKVSVSRMCEI